MNTLVTGANGLVGSTIDSKFKPTRTRLDLMDIYDIIRYININQIDSIIHCAAKVGGIKANSELLGEFYYENIMMNTNVLEAARQTGIKKVVSFMSTCVFPAVATYPLTSDQIHNGEPHSSNYAYAYAKRMLEVQSRAYREQYGCNFVTVIPCNIYGPNDNYNLDSGHVIPSLIHKCYLAKQNNTDFEIWGTGLAYREFVYSKDVGHITQWVLENYDDPEPFIISPDEEICISTIAQEIAWRMGFEGNLVYNGKMEGQWHKPSDNSKLKSLLPKYAFVPIEMGLQKSIDWFVENYEKVRK
ncbi:MAG: NAD-dependent epimerase/dehydratase family protein [Proteobacteria bacterium]|nr:NAD-dependent epimerase/dehydratase family protein [Pseudomonadota bacterium]